MPQVKVYDLKSKESGSVALSDEVFAAPVNKHLLHDSVLNHLANRRRESRQILLNLHQPLAEIRSIAHVRTEEQPSSPPKLAGSFVGVDLLLHNRMKFRWQVIQNMSFGGMPRCGSFEHPNRRWSMKQYQFRVRESG